MLIVKTISREPVKKKFTCQGAELEVSIRPLDKEIMTELAEKVRVFEFVHNPKTEKMERVAVVDDDRYTRAMYDWIIADFSGVGSGPDKPWPVDEAHKWKLANLASGKSDVKTLAAQITAAARDLGKALHAELEAERKNS